MLIRDLMSNSLLYAELPPRPLLERLAKELRRRLVSLTVHCVVLWVHGFLFSKSVKAGI